MVDLGCQDTDWVGGNVKEVSDAILLLDGHFGHEQRKMLLSWVHVWLIWGPEGTPWVTDG